MPTPLNPRLYDALNDLTEVHTVRPGMTNGWRDKELSTSGEEYWINCPQCDDDRVRLMINHVWAARRSLLRNRQLIRCYSAGCQRAGLIFDLRLSLFGQDPLNFQVLKGSQTPLPYDPLPSTIRSLPVLDVRYSRGGSNTPSLRVDYLIQDYVQEVLCSEWICLEHEHTNYARRKAEEWWSQHSDDLPVPGSVSEALEIANAGLLRSVQRITVRNTPGDPFDRIQSCVFEPSETLRRYIQSVTRPGEDATGTAWDELVDAEEPVPEVRRKILRRRQRE